MFTSPFKQSLLDLAGTKPTSGSPIQGLVRQSRFTSIRAPASGATSLTGRPEITADLITANGLVQSRRQRSDATCKCLSARKGLGNPRNFLYAPLHYG